MESKIQYNNRKLIWKEVESKDEKITKKKIKTNKKNSSTQERKEKTIEKKGKTRGDSQLILIKQSRNKMKRMKKERYEQKRKMLKERSFQLYEYFSE